MKELRFDAHIADLKTRETKKKRQATIMKNLARIRKQLHPARRKKIATRAAALI